MKTKSYLPYIIAGAAGAIVASVTPLFTTPSRAADTKLLPFQGRLTDANGVAVTDGTKVVEFKMYDAPTGESLKNWAGEVHKLSVNGGLVNTMLGSKASLELVDFSMPTYLQITIDANNDGQINAADPPLLPRQSVVGAIYASEAGNAKKLRGYDWAALFQDGSNQPTNNIASGFLKPSLFGANSIDGSRLVNQSVGFPAISADVISSLGGSLTQGSLVPSMTAQEAIADRDAVAITKDAGNNVRLLKSNSSVGSRSAFYGFAKGAAALGAPVTILQFGALSGFTGLSAGSSYYVGTTDGTITSSYPAGNPIYVGYALAADTLFVDPFGVTRKWSNQNYWGNSSDGALSTTGDVNLASTLDGDVVVKQYGSLTLNAGHTITVQNRCRGLVIYVDGNCTINGTLTMTKRGAFANPSLTDSIAPTGIRLVRRKAGAAETLAATDLGGAGLGGVGVTWPMVESLQPGIDNNGKIYTAAREGGAGGAGEGIYNGGNPGGTHLRGTGGGGSSSGSNTYVGYSGASGTCYSGGSGSGAPSSGNGAAPHEPGSQFGGPGGRGNDSGFDQNLGGGGGGGAGNPGGIGGTGPRGNGQPGGDGTGGLLILIVRGNLTIGTTGVVSANGASGGAATYDGAGSGGGSGGGRILMLHAGSLSNTGSVQANGGQGGQNQFYVGKNGGNGAITLDQINP